MKNPIHQIIIIMMLVGVGFTVAGLAAGWYGTTEKNEFKENGVPVTARIHNLEEYTSKTSDGNTTTSYNVYVSFVTRDNEEIITKLNYYSSSMRVGQSIDIMYHKDYPYNIFSEKTASVFMVLAFVFTGCGLGMTTGAIIIIFKQIQKKKLQKRLRDTGRVIRASKTGIVEVTSITVNGFHPQVLEAEFNGTVYRSRYLTMKEIEKISLDGTVDVYVDREDEKKYFVDLENVK